MEEEILYNVLTEFINNKLNKNIKDEISFKRTINNSINIIKMYDKIYFQKTFNDIMFMVFQKYNIIHKDDIKFVDNFDKNIRINYLKMSKIVYDNLYS